MKAVQRMTSAWHRFLFCDIDTGCIPSMHAVAFDSAESGRQPAAQGHAAAR
jgi:hypothetical protein